MGFAGLQAYDDSQEEQIENFAKLIVLECSVICLELAAKCAGLPDAGALATDCANQIEEDFEVNK